MGTRIRGEIVKMLVEAGAPLDALNEEAHTPLYLACRGNHIDTVEYLLAKGALVCVDGGESPFKLKLSADMAQIIFKASKDSLCIKDLEDALEGDSIEMIRLVLAGKTLHLEDLHGNLEHIERLSDDEIGRVFFEECHRKWTLKDLIRLNCPRTFQKLGPNLVSPGSSLDSDLLSGAILRQASFGNACLVSELVNLGANVNAVEPETAMTPLMEACKNIHPETIIVLLDLGASATMQSSDGGVALEHLLDALAEPENGDPDFEDENDEEMSLEESDGGHSELDEWQDEDEGEGGDSAAKTIDPKEKVSKECRSTLACAVKRLIDATDPRMVTGEILADALLSKDSDLLVNVFAGFPNASLWITPELINTVCSETALLHAACSKGLPNLLSLLVSHGADVNRQCLDDGKAALHYASESGCLKIAKTLVEAGASLDALDFNDCTALYLACENYDDLVVEFLLRKGASTTVGASIFELPLSDEIAELVFRQCKASITLPILRQIIAAESIPLLELILKNIKKLNIELTRSILEDLPKGEAYSLVCDFLKPKSSRRR